MYLQSMLAGVSRGMKKTEIRVTTLLSRTQSKLWNLLLKEKKTSVDNFNPKTKETNTNEKETNRLAHRSHHIHRLSGGDRKHRGVPRKAIPNPIRPEVR